MGKRDRERPDKKNEPTTEAETTASEAQSAEEEATTDEVKTAEDEAKTAEAVTKAVTEAVSNAVANAVTAAVEQATASATGEASAEAVSKAVAEAVTAAVAEAVTTPEAAEAGAPSVSEAVTEAVSEALTEAEEKKKKHRYLRSPQLLLGRMGDRKLKDRGIVRKGNKRGGFDIRVDWKGDESDGLFEVKVSEEDYLQIDNLKPNGTNNVVVSSELLTGKQFSVRFERGPHHPDRQFGAKAIPVDWSETEQVDFSSIVELGTHYDYRENLPDEKEWVFSTESGDGTQEVSLTLPLGQDFEIWVLLQHPENPEKWRVQDPIVHPETGGGGQTGGGGK